MSDAVVTVRKDDVQLLVKALMHTYVKPELTAALTRLQQAVEADVGARA